LHAPVHQKVPPFLATIFVDLIKYATQQLRVNQPLLGARLPSVDLPWFTNPAQSIEVLMEQSDLGMSIHGVTSEWLMPPSSGARQ
jgi:hypothetical protein